LLISSFNIVSVGNFFFWFLLSRLRFFDFRLRIFFLSVYTSPITQTIKFVGWLNFFRVVFLNLIFFMLCLSTLSCLDLSCVMFAGLPSIQLSHLHDPDHRVWFAWFFFFFLIDPFLNFIFRHWICLEFNYESFLFVYPNLITRFANLACLVRLT
jgi:hypothetical protein